MISFKNFINEAECQMGLNRSVKRRDLALKKRLLQRLAGRINPQSLKRRMDDLRDKGRNI